MNRGSELSSNFILGLTALTVMGAAACGAQPPRPQSARAPTAQAPTARATSAPNSGAGTTPTAARVPPEPPPSAKPTLAELARQVVPAWTEAMSRHDAKKLAAMYTEDATLESGEIEPARGREAIARSAQQMFDVFSTLKVRAARVWVTDHDDVVVEWVMTGTFSGPWKGIAPTEKPVGVEGASVLWMTDDGLIERERVYADSAKILSQIGATKAKPPPVLALPAQTEWHEWQPVTTEEDARSMAPLAAKPATLDAEVRVDGTWRVEDFAILAWSVNGKRNRVLRVLDVAQVKDGNILRNWTYGDAAEIARDIKKK